MTLLALACPNGLGHVRRLVAILARLLDLRPDLSVTVACSGAQVATLGEGLGLPASRVRVLTGVTDPGVHWADSPGAYSDGRLRDWEKRLDGLDVASFDAVLSDNLTGILERRPDAVLSGSFLWSEVLGEAYPEDARVKDFVAREQDLLARHRPAMLCVGALATPGVLSRTQAVDVGFTVFDPVLPVDPDPRDLRHVAVLGGATGAAAAIHARLIRGLLADSWALRLAPRDIAFLNLEDDPHVTGFDFSPADYRRCAAIVLRPGLGTVHEAIAAGVPMVCSYEERQMEMSHVAGRLAALGLARDFGSSGDAAALAGVLSAIMEPAARAEFSRARSGLKLDGVNQAAAWLSKRFGKARS